MRRLFVLLLLVIAVAACESEPPSVVFEDLPPGDAGSGQKLYLQSVNDAPTCASCHEGEGLLGPNLADYRTVAGDRVDGESAEEYTYWSIVRPTRHVIQGYSNVMYQEYEDVLTEQDIADLIAYLLEF